MTHEYVIIPVIVNNELERMWKEKVISFFKAPSLHLCRGTEEYFEKSLTISILRGKILLQGFPGTRNVKYSTAEFGGLSAGNEGIHKLLGYTGCGPSFETGTSLIRSKID
jgi:hypothetical protein